MADLQERTRTAERRVAEIGERIRLLQRQTIDSGEVQLALAQFDPVWEALTPREQARVIELLVERVDFDGDQGKVAVTFHPDGIRNFGHEFVTAEDAA